MNSNLLLKFLLELKQYNSTNFKTLTTVDLSTATPEVCKAFSSVITRYFIFLEKHPEIKPAEANMLYYRLKLDTVARFFSEFPAANLIDLQPFQRDVLYYLNEYRKEFNYDS